MIASSSTEANYKWGYFFSFYEEVMSFRFEKYPKEEQMLLK